MSWKEKRLASRLNKRKAPENTEQRSEAREQRTEAIHPRLAAELLGLPRVRREHTQQRASLVTHDLDSRQTPAVVIVAQSIPGQRSITDLPHVLLLHAMRFLGGPELVLDVARVCGVFRAAVQSLENAGNGAFTTTHNNTRMHTLHMHAQHAHAHSHTRTHAPHTKFYGHATYKLCVCSVDWHTVG
jgi:hypothetical protein